VSDLERGERTRLAVRVAGDPDGNCARHLDPEVASVEQVKSGTVLLVRAERAGRTVERDGTTATAVDTVVRAERPAG
jgi:hypothetical protein